VSLRTLRSPGWLVPGLVVVCLLVVPAVAATAAPPHPKAKFSAARAFDVSPVLRDVSPKASLQATPLQPSAQLIEIRPERGPVAKDKGFSGDGALLGGSRTAQEAALVAAAIPSPFQNFEGISYQDNFNLFGFRVNPPDPVGDVGPDH